MDEFLSRFWNLEQVRVWAETRDPEVVRFAALAKDVAAQRQSACIAIRAKFAATNAAKAGRDIDAELWTASGETPTVRPWMPPRIIERELERRGIPAHELMFEEGLHVQQPKRLAVAGDALQPETSGPPYVFIRGAFPTIQYLEGLFRSGELVAIGNIHDDPIVREISVRDWSSLEIACGGDARRLSVWKRGQVRNEGRGDFENVSVEREDVLREFPAEPASAQPKKTCSDDEALELIHRAKEENGGFIGQNDGFKIVRALCPNFNREQIRALIKQVTGNAKPGPKGPRKNRAANRADHS